VLDARDWTRDQRQTERIGVRAFGITTWVRSPQVVEIDALKNRDRRMYAKWGLEPSYDVVPGKVRVSALRPRDPRPL